MVCCLSYHINKNGTLTFLVWGTVWPFMLVDDSTSRLCQDKLPDRFQSLTQSIYASSCCKYTKHRDCHFCNCRAAIHTNGMQHDCCREGKGIFLIYFCKISTYYYILLSATTIGERRRWISPWMFDLAKLSIVLRA